ncbi:MAG: hypothetical protein IPO09_13560 [Anaeromyxobacter sp.]|nr:hypothetical protein [Anaeromyxobacter sp.]MBL0275211.1 hypothetical protein [Anaeromyxobacter sp.]
MPGARRGHPPLLLALVAALGACGSEPTGTVGAWRLGAPMIEARSGHSATVLPSGLVLVAGGAGAWHADGSADILASAELYDPVTGVWTPAASMGTARGWHSATLLQDGRVLVAGGVGAQLPGRYTDLTSAELYDPATNRWEETGSMAWPRDGEAVLLPDGQVLVAGACLDDGTVLAVSERYDPVSGTWSDAGALPAAQYSMPMVLLGPAGPVLLAGGISSRCTTWETAGLTSRAHLYDLTTRTWRATAPLPVSISDHTLTLLWSGEVLLTSGGRGRTQNPGGPALLFDPAQETWRPTGPMAWTHHVAEARVLPSGRVLVAAGNWVDDEGDYHAPGGDVYDAGLDAWSPTPVLPHHVLAWCAAVTLPSGEVLLTGGEIFSPGPSRQVTISAVQLFRE